MKKSFFLLGILFLFFALGAFAPCTIVFDSDRDGNREIYRMNPDGSDVRRLTDNPGEDRDPIWSPDGTMIAFISDRDGGPSLYTMNEDGGDIKRLTTNGHCASADWSPDGKEFVLSLNGGLWRLKADGSEEPQQVSPALSDFRPKWSPDGKQIAWVNHIDNEDKIFAGSIDGQYSQQVTDYRAGEVEWTPDGRLFISTWAWKGKQEFCYNCIFDLSNGEITDAGGKDEALAFRPFRSINGSRAWIHAFSPNGKPNDQIMIISPAFPEFLKNISQNSANDRNPNWSAGCPAVVEPIDLAKKTIGYTEFGEISHPSWWEDIRQTCENLRAKCVQIRPDEISDQALDALIIQITQVQLPGIENAIDAFLRDQQAPVFILDAESEIAGTYNITIDHAEWMKTGLRWELDQLDGKGNLIIYDLSPAIRFKQAIDEVLAAYPEIKVVKHSDGKEDIDKIKPESADIVLREKNIDAIWAGMHTDNVIRGMVEYPVPYDLWPKLNCVYAEWGADFWQEILDKYPEFQCIAVGESNEHANVAVHAAVNLLSGMMFNPDALGGKGKNSLYLDFKTAKTADELREMSRRDIPRLSPDEIRQRWFLVE